MSPNLAVLLAACLTDNYSYYSTPRGVFTGFKYKHALILLDKTTLGVLLTQYIYSTGTASGKKPPSHVFPSQIHTILHYIPTNRPLSQCIRQISHDSPFCSRKVHTCVPVGVRACVCACARVYNASCCWVQGSNHVQVFNISSKFGKWKMSYKCIQKFTSLKLNTWFVVYCYCLIPANITHILQDYITGTVTTIWQLQWEFSNAEWRK